VSVALKPLNSDQRAWQYKILFSTYMAYAGFYLVRKAFGSAKPLMLEEGSGYDFGLHGVSYISALPSPSTSSSVSLIP
jgi:sugar phosphate permease